MGIFRNGKVVTIICIASFLRSFGAVVRTVAIFYFPDVFKTGEIETGIIVGMLSLASVFGIFFYPFIAKKIGVYRTHIVVSILGTMSYLICALFYDKMFLVIIGMITAYFCIAIKGLMIKKAIIMNTTEERRKSAFSLNYMVINLAFMISPIIAIDIYGLNSENMKYLFLVDALFTFISFLMIYKMFNTDTEEDIEKVKYEKVDSGYRFVFLTITLLLVALGITQMGYLVPKSAVSNYSLDIYKYLIIINTVLCVLLIPLLHRFGSFKKEINNLLLGIFFIAISLLLFNYGSNENWQYLAMVVMTFGEVYYVTNIDTYLSKVFRKSEHDIVLTINNLSFKAVQVIGPIIISLIIFASSGYKAAFNFCVILQIVAIGLFVMLDKYLTAKRAG